MLISKKKLLEVTNISYGQLYRWKRENLIPAEWFIKQPSFTGQETFFPKDKIIPRIEMIQSLKDKYSLEELSKILSPEISGKNFTVEDIKKIKEIHVDILNIFVKLYEKDCFSFIEIVCLYAFSVFYKKDRIPDYEIKKIIFAMKKSIEGIKSCDYSMLMLVIKERNYCIITAENFEVYFDERITIKRKLSLNDLSGEIKTKYGKNFNMMDSIDDINDDVKNMEE